MSQRDSGDRSQPLSMSDLGASLPPGGAAALSAADRAGLVNVLKDKLQSLAGQSSGYLDALPKMVKRRVKALQELQTEHDELEAKFHEERAALEAKYQKLYDPLYSKRFEIVNGVVEVEAPKDEAPEADAPTEAGKEEGKGVPEFWLTAMKTNEIVGMQITERDEAALKFIKDIKSSNLEDNKGFKLDFFFEENPYFKNTVLSKTYHMIDDDEPILERAVGTEIEWLSGKNLTQKVMKKKPKKGGAKNTKPVTKTEQCESFFNFFTPPQVPEDDDIDQDTAEQLQDSMEQDYDVGSTIRDKIIPHAVSWFTGDALAEEEFEDDDEEGDDDDEDDEDEDEEDEDEDEDEDDEDEETEGKPAPKGRAPKAAGGQQQSGEQPPECKQQ